MYLIEIKKVQKNQCNNNIETKLVKWVYIYTYTTYNIHSCLHKPYFLCNIKLLELVDIHSCILYTKYVLYLDLLTYLKYCLEYCIGKRYQIIVCKFTN